jgi:acyl-CoA synthetase (AMP-forming)/AMP-acid ligase II
VGAVVRLKAGAAADAQALRSHVAARLAAHKVPFLLDFREAPFPRNAAGKALKRELRAEALAGHEPMEG